MTACMACAPNGQCSACIPGYIINNTSNTCVQVGYGCTINACQVCSSSQSCGQCQLGYQLTPFQVGNLTVNLCQQMLCPFNVKNCNYCTYLYGSIFNFNNFLCAPGQCQTGFIYVNGYCVANLTLAPISCSNVTNCLQCSYPNFCSQCANGFSLSDHGSCVPTVCNVQNCQYCNQNEICQVCNPGYSLSLGNLAILNPTSGLYTFTNYLLLQQCLPNSIICNISNCAYCFSNNTCDSCAQGYDFSVNNTNLCIAVCNVSNCYQCVEGVNPSACSVCQPQYTLIDGECQQISFSCG